jgi:hypothetical protein
VYPTFNVQCENPFEESIEFRSPFFGNANKYIGELHKNLSDTLKNCTRNIGLVPHTGDAYLKVEFKACPEDRKRFTYYQVLNCFNLTLQTYKPPEKFGPYYVEARPYLFHDKGN